MSTHPFTPAIGGVTRVAMKKGRNHLKTTRMTREQRLECAKRALIEIGRRYGFEHLALMQTLTDQQGQVLQQMPLAAWVDIPDWQPPESEPDDLTHTPNGVPDYTDAGVHPATD